MDLYDYRTRTRGVEQRHFESHICHVLKVRARLPENKSVSVYRTRTLTLVYDGIELYYDHDP
jgi:hypothetical protein